MPIVKPQTQLTIKNSRINLSFSDIPKNATLHDYNVLIVKAYLNYTGQNLSKTANLLNISRQTIYNWLEEGV